MKYQEPMTVHHKIPETWGGSLQPGNTVMLREKVHQSLHTIFQCDTPIQRLRRILEVDKSTLHPDVYSQISNVLARFEGVMEVNVYDPRLFNSDKFLKKGKQPKQ